MASFWRKIGGATALVAIFFGAGCALTDLASLKVMYQRADIPESRIHRDLAYREGILEDNRKQRLDLYVPEGKNWPVLVFVHGGGWDTGDRRYEVAGVDPYANIGRFFASRGVGTAVISYRLLPDVAWREQIQDVAGAVAWVSKNAAKFGGNPKRLFLSGHSAGAQLAARVALDPEPLKSEGFSKKIVTGVIAVSGAGYQIAGEELRSTRGGRKGYYERRFQQGDTTDSWKEEVSLLRFVDKSAPPFLLFYGSAEPTSISEQTKLLADRLSEAEVPAKLVVIPHRDHVQTVMTLSREDSETAREALEFIRPR
jgi:acetyl esterase/lipase